MLPFILCSTSFPYTTLFRSFTGDVNVQLISPQGTVVDVFEVGGCAGAFPIDTWFDDEGVNPVDCNGLDLPRIFPIFNAGFSIAQDRKSTRLNSSHLVISYAVFCLKKIKN